MVTVQTPSKFDVFFAAKRNFYDAKQCFFREKPGFYGENTKLRSVEWDFRRLQPSIGRVLLRIMFLNCVY